MQNILIIDDDTALGELLVEYLSREALDTTVAPTGKEGLELALSGRFDLVLLDLILPDVDGLTMLYMLRKQDGPPVLILSGRGDDVSRIVGLEMGADDFLPKPFEPRELVARMRAILRRTSKAKCTALSELRVGDLRLEPRLRQVWRGEERLTLTQNEFNLLETLLRSAGQVVTKDDLSLAALGRELSPLDRSVDVHISNLRRKLGPQPDESERIRTVRGVGYMYLEGLDEVGARLVRDEDGGGFAWVAGTRPKAR